MGRSSKARDKRQAAKQPVDGPRTAPGGRFLDWLPLLVAVLAVAVAAAHVLVQIELVDEGVLNMGAWRITQGQVPYRDFFIFYTPFSFYLVAAAYKVFGVSILTGRVLGLLLGIGLVAVTAKLSKRLIPSPLFAAVPVAVLCQAGLGCWPFASHHWIADIFSILAVILAWKAMSERTFLWSSLAGACAAGALWTLNDQGAFLIVLVAVLYLPWLKPEVRRNAMAGWAAGGLAASAPFLALLLIKVPWATLWYDFAVFPLTGYKAVAGNRYGFTFPLQEIATQWASGAWKGAPVYSALASVTSLSVYFAPAVALVLLGVAHRKKWEDGPRRGLIAAGVLAFVGTAARRWGPINLQWAAVFPALMVAWGLWRWREGSAPRRRWVPTAIAVTLLACFCGVGLYRIGKVLSPGIPYPVRGRAGTLYTFSKRQAVQLQEVIDQIQSRLKPGDPLLCRAVPLVNFLTLSPNPAPIDLFAPPAYTPESQAKEVIGAIDAKGLEWIMTPAFIPGENAFDRYLLAHYSLTWDNREYGLWHRNAPGQDAGH